MLMMKFENGKRFYVDCMGNKYQYDLTNPSDELSYKTDVAAQMRDKLSITPTRDRNGGGIYD